MLEHSADGSERPVVLRVARRLNEWMAQDRKARKQVDLAAKCQLSQSHISRVLAGAVGVPLDILDKLADATGIPPSDFVRKDQNEARELVPSEARLLRAFRDLSKEERALLIDLTVRLAAKGTEPSGPHLRPQRGQFSRHESMGR